MKKKLLIAALLICCLAITAAGSIAYFNAEDVARNVITTGDIDIEIHEWDADGNEWKDLVGVMPGAEVTKIAEIENLTDSDAWIRVRVQKVLTLSSGEKGKDTDLLDINFNTEDWTEKDGYYYYNKPLTPSDKVTSPVFTSVKFNEKMTDEYQGARADVIVYAQAVQCKNNGDTVFEATGWPAQSDLTLSGAAIQ